MGMDVYGIAPSNEKGNYFRNNVWWWRPLWDYCQDVAPSYTQGINGHNNDGDGIKDSALAREFGHHLMLTLSNGTASEYIAERNRTISEMPMEECSICNSTGIRADEIGKEHGQDTKALSDDLASVYGRTHGWCNGCDGAGEKLPWATNYPLTEENIKEFADFCIESGGFEIC